MGALGFALGVGVRARRAAAEVVPAKPPALLIEAGDRLLTQAGDALLLE